MTDGGSRWNAYILNIAQPTLTTISKYVISILIDWPNKLWKLLILFSHPLLNFLGRSIFVVDGELWKKARHATSTIFTVNTFKARCSNQRRQRTIIEPCASRSMEGLTDKLRSATGEEHSIDVCNLFFWFTFNSVAQMTFGKDLDLLGAKYSTETDSPASSRLAQLEQSNFRLTLIVGWKLIESLNSSMGKRMKHSIRIMDNFVYSLLDERIASLSQLDCLKEADHVPRDLLGLFMDACDKRGGGLSRTKLRDTAIWLQVFERKPLRSWANSKAIAQIAKVALANNKIPDGPTIHAGDVLRWRLQTLLPS
ncbi:hypothetical protein PSHT_00452 [Puccinia striiformis]|uniref:Cytochrome P450 n=1 Tax=Puccinia striiformis TaxID=27350 RepID=A0A2S4WMY5_9BASI|nr:hypothetical protein PSHT_00452 [Puccinia striiformis]